MIEAPPLLAGALQLTLAVLDPVALADTLCGALGKVATTVLVELLLADTLPAALVAVTTQRIVNPTSDDVNVYVLDVAPPILDPPRCHWYE